jgi:hypothetical protein
MIQTSAISWKSAVGLSSLAIYGPYCVMATYAQLFVPCSHCKEAAWTLLPFAPGLLPTDAGSRLLGWARPSDPHGPAIALILSLAMLLILTCIARRGGWPRIIAVALAMFMFSGLAIGTLGMIRA